MNPTPSPRPRPGGALRLSAACAAAALLGACATAPPPPADDAVARLRAELAAQAAAPAAPAAVPAPPAAPPARAEPAGEPRFDLIVNGANARDVFLSMVADTRYSMLMHPDVNGQLSVTLRGVTVREALESIRDVYGYDFRIDGRRITVYPPTLQTRIYTLNYLHAKRQGRSEVRVSGSGAPNGTQGGGAGSAAGGVGPNGVPDASQITTSSQSDLWSETADALRGLLGGGEGRQVIVSPQAGTIAVRALPDELRQVEQFLRASQIAVERQVMLEAKIVEVELRQGYESGIDWSVLRPKGMVGQTSGNPDNPLLGNDRGLPTLPAVPQALGALLLNGLPLPAGVGATFGLSLATNGFEAVIAFLEIYGRAQVLSSPRVATLNNQKAVLKVGTDEYFVTNVSGGTFTPGTTTTGGTTTLPTVTLTPFFSGIALDVTPQIDDAGMITLHLRPSVTTVTEKTKRIDLGTIGNYRLPLASSSVNETDTIVRVPDGHIVAIGGLMQDEAYDDRSGMPGTGGNAVTRHLLGNNVARTRKKELVVLVRPTIIRGAEDWQRTTGHALGAFDDAAPRRVITLDGAAPAATPAMSPAVTPPVAPAVAGR